MRTWYLLPKPGDMNEATEYYVRTIERAGRALGHSLERVDSLNEIPFRADVLVIDCKTAFKLLIARPFCRIWLWIQGIVPEESALHFGDGLRNKLRKAYWTAFERVAIPRARGTFLVSQAMRRHYAMKYGFTSLPTFIMPCVNQELNESAFEVPSKYTNPTFVYAGSMHRWQCFDLTLQVFRRVQQRRPDARLTVLTGDENLARGAVRQVGMNDVMVGRVPLDRLQETLRAFKYGFVLRKDHVVNAVATPTKVSSYMAAGIIPIMTMAVHDYAAQLRSLDNLIMSPGADADRIADQILAFEERTISPQHVLAEYRRVFDDYFAHRRYVPGVVAFLRRTGLGERSRDPVVAGSSGRLSS